MSQNPHGHDVLDLLSETPMTKEELKAKLEEKLGSELVFRTCKFDAIAFDELFEFFVQRGKIVESDGVYSTVKAKICTHS
ncbi:YecH family protein [Vibrio hannami]|uniref:YecH family metal-binding protein n=1 Tax=Vibrio hannami TaxID=2717094 RepID=UPI00240F1410|nr:YecH family metal-binding protein [Vibrio hannami]MDG3086668.1 YecH family protein [Vibrio hannami]